MTTEKRTRVGDDVSFRDQRGCVHTGTVINSRFSAWSGVQTWTVWTPDGEYAVTADRFLRGAGTASTMTAETPVPLTTDTVILMRMWLDEETWYDLDAMDAEIIAQVEAEYPGEAA